MDTIYKDDWTIQNPITVNRDTHSNRDMIDSLCDKLPHGSGINYKWCIEQSKRNNHVWYVSNTFEAMNENGYYCHNYHFTFKIKYNGKNLSEPCPYCHNEINDRPGYRSYTDMMRYGWSLESFINELGGMSFSNGEWYTDCKGCHTTGKIMIPEWEVIKLNFHGQKERGCCGYGLIDYLSQLINDCIR